MSTYRKLKDALKAIEDARDSLKRAAQNVPEGTNIRFAMKELAGAERLVEQAGREVRRMDSVSLH